MRKFDLLLLYSQPQHWSLYDHYNHYQPKKWTTARFLYLSVSETREIANRWSLRLYIYGIYGRRRSPKTLLLPFEVANLFCCKLKLFPLNQRACHHPRCPRKIHLSCRSSLSASLVSLLFEICAWFHCYKILDVLDSPTLLPESIPSSRVLTFWGSLEGV